MTQVTKEDIARMEQEDVRFQRGEGFRQKQPRTPTNKKRNRGPDLKSLRGASPQTLRDQFKDDFDDDFDFPEHQD